MESPRPLSTAQLPLQLSPPPRSPHRTRSVKDNSKRLSLLSRHTRSRSTVVPELATTVPPATATTTTNLEYSPTVVSGPSSNDSTVSTASAASSASGNSASSSYSTATGISSTTDTSQTSALQAPSTPKGPPSRSLRRNQSVNPSVNPVNRHSFISTHRPSNSGSALQAPQTPLLQSPQPPATPLRSTKRDSVSRDSMYSTLGGISNTPGTRTSVSGSFAPPMRGVWLDDEDEDDEKPVSRNRHTLMSPASAGLSSVEASPTKHKPSSSMSFSSTLRRLGSKASGSSAKKAPTLTTPEIGSPRALRPDPVSPSPQRRLPATTMRHRPHSSISSSFSGVSPARPSAATSRVSAAAIDVKATPPSTPSAEKEPRQSSASRLLKFFVSSSPSRTPRAVTKQAISAPSNFVHAGHVDASTKLIDTVAPLMGATTPLHTQTARPNQLSPLGSLAHLRKHSASSLSTANSVSLTGTADTTPSSDLSPAPQIPPRTRPQPQLPLSKSSMHGPDSYGAWAAPNADDQRWLANSQGDVPPVPSPRRTLVPGRTNSSQDSFWNTYSSFGGSTSTLALNLPDQRQSALLPSPMIAGQRELHGVQEEAGSVYEGNGETSAWI